MSQSLMRIALLVRDYDEAIDFYTKKLHFDLIENTPLPEAGKRWVVIAPKGSVGTNIVLTKVTRQEQEFHVGNQAGSKVFLFLGTDNFSSDYNEMLTAGVEFVTEPQTHEYGTVAVFKDLYGNLWDLIEYK